MKILRSDALMYGVVGTFLVSSFANFHAAVFGANSATFLGFFCTLLYLSTWVLSVILFGERKGWLRFVLYMRWLTVGAVLFLLLSEALQSRFGFSGFLNVAEMFSAAVAFTVYCGFRWIGNDAWPVLAAIGLQALTVTGLWLWLRLRGKGASKVSS